MYKFLVDDKIVAKKESTYICKYFMKKRNVCCSLEPVRLWYVYTKLDDVTEYINLCFSDNRSNN